MSLCVRSEPLKSRVTRWFGWERFSKTAPDIEPLRLAETDSESFCWRPTLDVPTHLAASVKALDQGRSFNDKADIVKTIQGAGVARTTAYRHFDEMLRRGMLVEVSGGYELKEAVAK